MLGYLILVGDDGTISKEDQDAADKVKNDSSFYSNSDLVLKSRGNQIVKKFVEYVKKDWGAITTASSLDLLVVLDKQRGSWTNEDPSYQDAIKNAEDQIKTDPPSSPVRPSLPIIYLSPSLIFRYRVSMLWSALPRWLPRRRRIVWPLLKLKTFILLQRTTRLWHSFTSRI